MQQQPKTTSLAVGLVAYLLAQLVLPALKLAGVTSVAHWSWARTLCLLWGPWLLFLVMLVVMGVLVRLPKWVPALRGKDIAHE